ncbi:unnamed protein product, partial [Polarella glacialis]
VPPKWTEAKAACEIALTVDAKHVKALFRRAQALLEDNREGLPEESLRLALADLQAALQSEPDNAQVSREVERISRRLAALEAKRQVPKPAEILERVSPALLDRGTSELASHGYVWGQTESMVHVFVPARGRRILKSSEITCEVKSKQLTFQMPVADGQRPLKLDGKLCKQVEIEECSWQLEEGGLLLHIELAKRDTSEDGEHWLRVFEGHAPITKVATAK